VIQQKGDEVFMDVNNRSVFTETTRRSHLALAWSSFNLVLVLCGGCAVAPRQETRLFATAFTTFDGASQPLFDDLAIAERRQGKQTAETLAKSNAKKSNDGDAIGSESTKLGGCQNVWKIVSKKADVGYIAGLCVSDASYFSEIGDPPATRAFRAGVRLIGEYADVLVTLAEGRNVDEAAAQVQALGGTIAGLASMASGPGATAGMTAVLAALDPLIKEAAQQRNIEEMKRLLLNGAPHVKKLIQALRAAAPEMFEMLIKTSATTLALDDKASGNPEIAKGPLERIATYRIAVSNYVILLDQLEETFDELVTAIKQPRNGASLAFIARRSAELSANAVAWRKVYSTIRTGTE
jgi:hypothetical protein